MPGTLEWMKEHGLPVNCRPLDLEKLLQDSQYDTVILSFWYIADHTWPGFAPGRRPPAW